MLVGEGYFPHINAEKERQIALQLERRRIALERASEQSPPLSVQTQDPLRRLLKLLHVRSS